MRVLMVTPYPPLRDGIANYAVQAVLARRAQGDDVTVLSPGPSAAHLHLDLAGVRGAMALARRVRAFDEVVVQYHPAFFYDSAASARRSATDLALAAAFRVARRSVAVLHEVEYAEFEADASRRRAATALWRSLDELHFHSEVERTRFLALFPVEASRAVVVAHGETFVRRTRVDRQAARASLGLPAQGKVLLSIGFIQRHKGFDRAVTAFRGLAETGAELHVVGSTRLDEPEFLQYLEELEELTARTPGSFLHTGYVSDERFDRWLVACDLVVLPYREIWSSGVLERAALYDRPVLATRVGGLADQAGDRRVTFVDDDDDLRSALRAAVGLEEFEQVPDRWPVPVPTTGEGDTTGEADAGALWAAVQAEVRRRAAQRRGVSRDQVVPHSGSAGAPASPGPRGGTRLSAPVRRLPPAHVPPATSSRLGVSVVKRAVQRLTDWQVRPLARDLDALRTATVRALEAVEDEVSALRSAHGGSGTPPPPADTRPWPGAVEPGPG